MTRRLFDQAVKQSESLSLEEKQALVESLEADHNLVQKFIKLCIPHVDAQSEEIETTTVSSLSVTDDNSNVDDTIHSSRLTQERLQKTARQSFYAGQKEATKGLHQKLQEAYQAGLGVGQKTAAMNIQYTIYVETQKAYHAGLTAVSTMIHTPPSPLITDHGSGVMLNETWFPKLYDEQGKLYIDRHGEKIYLQPI